MKKVIIILVSAIFITYCYNLYACNIEVCGDYSGTKVWDIDTVKVTCDVVCDILTIMPGTVVEFHGYYGIQTGTFIANGTITDSIIFTVNDTTGFYDLETGSGSWKGIRAYNSMEMNYCKTEYAKDFIEPTEMYIAYGVISIIGDECIKNSKFVHNYSKYNSIVSIFPGLEEQLIDSCTFSYNLSDCLKHKDYYSSLINIMNCSFTDNSGHALIVSAYPGTAIIKNCIIQNNEGFGIKADGDDLSLYIDNNFISGNNGGIYTTGVISGVNIRKNIILSNKIRGGIELNSSGYIRLLENNIICNNKDISSIGGGGGVSIYGGMHMSFILNNTICNNTSQKGGGIYFAHETPTIIYNTIITGNKADTGNQIYYDHNPLSHVYSCSYYNCNIENASEVENMNEFTDEFSNIINVDPYFEDTANYNYHLTDSSLCINAGTNHITGYPYQIPTTDIDGNPRVFGNIVDIGAYEFYSDTVYFTQQPQNKSLCTGENTSLYSDGIDVFRIQWQKDEVDIPDATSKILSLTALTENDEGEYRSVVSNYEDTIYSDIAYVTVNPLPNAEITQYIALDGNNSVMLEANTCSEYLWNTGATSQTIFPDDPGEYWVMVTDANGCSNSDTITITFDPDHITDISQNDPEIYPNPVIDKLVIKFTDDILSFHVRIYDITGNIVHTANNINKVPFVLSVEDLESGVYILEVHNCRNVFQRKIIVE